MAAAIGAMIFQRRPRLAKLKLEGLPAAKLWRTILLESLLLLGAGCLTGAVFGLYGQQLADRTLAQSINFPVVYSVSALSALSEPRAHNGSPPPWRSSRSRDIWRRPCPRPLALARLMFTKEPQKKKKKKKVGSSPGTRRSRASPV